MNNLPAQKIVGLHIKSERIKKGLTGKDLASLLGCSQQQVSRIENGLIRLNLVQIFHIADSLEISVESLLANIGIQSSSCNELSNLVHYCKSEIVISPFY